MKKLKVILTLLFAMSFTLFLFSCGGAKSINRIRLEGYKTAFQEGEEFSVGDLKVSVRYSGSDEYVELKASEYDVDSSAYDATEAGEYLIIVTPKNQPEGQEAYSEDYYVTVEHSWVDKGDGLLECSCGASQETLELTDVVTTVAWGNQATLTEQSANSPAKAPIAGETHVNYYTLTQGQSIEMTLKILDVDTAATWNTPLMGLRNGPDGVLPREDNWVIGQVAGYTSPHDPSGATATSGAATSESELWQVFTNGTTWNASELVDEKDEDNPVYATVVVTYNYGMDDVFMIRHQLYAPGTAVGGTPTKTLTYTVRVPDASYEVAAYGEKVTYQVSKLVITKGSKVVEFEATQPDATVQPEGKMFDATGITTIATMNKNDKQTGEPLTVLNSYNAYAYIDVASETGTVSQRVSLATTPLQAGMYDFCLEFAGFVHYYTESGEAVGKAGAGNLISVVPSEFVQINGTAIKYNDILFESGAVALDYALNEAKDGIQIVVTGTAATLTSAQKEALGVSDNYFVAFKIIGAEGTFNAVTAEKGVAVVTDGETAGVKNIDVIVPLSSATANFNLILKNGEEVVQTVVVNVSGVVGDALPEFSAEIVESDFTLDAGGSYTVEFKGFTGSSIADIGDYQLTVTNASKSISEINEQVQASGSYKPFSSSLTSITAISYANGTLTVTYKIDAPELANLSSDNAFNATALNGADGKALLNVTYYYPFVFSAEPAADTGIVKVADGIYVFVSAKRMYVMKAFDEQTVGGNIRAGLETVVKINLMNKYGESYNLSMTLNADGTVAAQDSNELTTAKNTALKFVILGTVNNNGDYDRGGLMVMEVAVDAIGIRAENAKDVFFFTVNEDANAAAYDIYTVGADNLITKTTVEPEGERVTTQEYNCVTTGYEAYLYTVTIGDKEYSFYYGTAVTPASGEHTWTATGTENLEICSVCGYTREKVMTENGYNYITLSAAAEVANTDTSGEWWDSDALGAKALKGNFAIRYTWMNTRDPNWYQDVVFELTDGTKFFDMNFFNPAGAWGELWVASETSTVTTTITKNGAEATLVEQGDTANNAYLGAYTLYVTRIGSTVTMYQEIVCGTVDGEGNFTASGDVWVVNSVFTGFTTGALTGQITGNPYWVDDITVESGSIEITVLNEDVKFENPVVWTDWYDVPVSLPAGGVLTVWGTQKGTVAANWNTILFEFKEGFTGRLDNYGWTFAPEGSTSALGEGYTSTISINGGEFGETGWETFTAIARDCDWVIEFDWTLPSVVTVTVTISNATDTYECVYTLPVTNSSVSEFNIHFTAEAVDYFTVDGYTLKA